MIFSSVKEKFFFYKIPTILFSLIPLFLITGPFLSDLSISLISFFFLIYCLKNKNFSYFKNKYFYFFLIFCGYLIFNSLVNNLNFDSLKISFFYFRYGVFVIAIFTLLKTDCKFLKYFFYCIFICFVVLISDGFYQYFVGKNILGFITSDGTRVSSFFHKELILGSYISRLWPVFFGLSILFLKKENKFYFLLILIFVLSEALVFLSGDRSPFFYINLSAIFIIVFSQKLFKLRLFTLLFSVLLIIFISFINPTAWNRIFNQTLEGMNLVKGNREKQIYIFTEGHQRLYISAYKMFLDNKILGVGVKNYRKVCSDTKYYVNGAIACNTHPHNTYVQILTETGIIGFLFLITTIFYFCKYIFKHLIFKFKGKYYFNDFEICILSGLLIYIWPFIPTGSVFNNWLTITMILNLPLLMWSRKNL